MDKLDFLRIKRRKLREMSTVIFDKINEEVSKNSTCCRDRLEQHLEQLKAKQIKISSLDVQIENKIIDGAIMDAEMLDNGKWQEKFVEFKSKINFSLERLNCESSQIRHCKPLNICRPLTFGNQGGSLNELRVEAQELNLPVYESNSGTAICSPRKDCSNQSFVNENKNGCHNVESNIQHKELVDVGCIDSNQNLLNKEIEDSVANVLNKRESTKKDLNGELNKTDIKKSISNTITDSAQILQNTISNNSVCEVLPGKEKNTLENLSTSATIIETAAPETFKVASQSNSSTSKKELRNENNINQELLPSCSKKSNEPSDAENFNAHAAKIMNLLNYLDNLKQDFPSSEESLTKISEVTNVPLKKEIKNENITEKNNRKNVSRENKHVEVIDLESDEEMLNCNEVLLSIPPVISKNNSSLLQHGCENSNSLPHSTEILLTRDKSSIPICESAFKLQPSFSCLPQSNNAINYESLVSASGGNEVIQVIDSVEKLKEKTRLNKLLRKTTTVVTFERNDVEIINLESDDNISTDSSVMEKNQDSKKNKLEYNECK